MNSKRYWLRGGITGLVGGVLLSVPTAILILPLLPNSVLVSVFKIMDTFISVDETNGFASVAVANLGVLLTTSLFFTIAGTVLGWFYGRSKNRKFYAQ